TLLPNGSDNHSRSVKSLNEIMIFTKTAAPTATPTRAKINEPRRPVSKLVKLKRLTVARTTAPRMKELAANFQPNTFAKTAILIGSVSFHQLKANVDKSANTVPRLEPTVPNNTTKGVFRIPLTTRPSSNPAKAKRC